MEKKIMIVELNTQRELGSLNLESGIVTLTETGTGFLRLPLTRHAKVVDHGFILARISPSRAGAVVSVKETGTGKIVLNSPQQESELLAFQEARKAFLDTL